MNPHSLSAAKSLSRVRLLRPAQRMSLVVGMTFSMSMAMAANAGQPEKLEPLPEVGEPLTKTPAKPVSQQEITQTREQNAVTSVRVKKGDNTYYVTPTEQVNESQSGGKAAQWEIFEFRPRNKNTVPPEKH